MADTVLVYGPRRFEVTRGERALHVERFEIQGRHDARYRVVIENGGPEGDGRAERSRVLLNEVELVGDDERLPGGRTVLEDVSLAELNGLLLEIDGPAGAYITPTKATR